MKDALGCAWYNLKIDGEEYERARYEGDLGDHCPDCGTPTGHYHHAGCDIEACPKCRCQMISCGCKIEP